jgi:hypothetical protein
MILKNGGERSDEVLEAVSELGKEHLLNLSTIELEDYILSHHY